MEEHRTEFQKSFDRNLEVPNKKIQDQVDAMNRGTDELQRLQEKMEENRKSLKATLEGLQFLMEILVRQFEISFPLPGDPVINSSNLQSTEELKFNNKNESPKTDDGMMFAESTRKEKVENENDGMVFAEFTVKENMGNENDEENETNENCAAAIHEVITEVFEEVSSVECEFERVTEIFVGKESENDNTWTKLNVFGKNPVQLVEFFDGERLAQIFSPKVFVEMCERHLITLGLVRLESPMLKLLKVTLLSKTPRPSPEPPPLISRNVTPTEAEPVPKLKKLSSGRMNSRPRVRTRGSIPTNHFKVNVRMVDEHFFSNSFEEASKVVGGSFNKMVVVNRLMVVHVAENETSQLPSLPPIQKQEMFTQILGKCFMEIEVRKSLKECSEIGLSSFVARLSWIGNRITWGFSEFASIYSKSVKDAENDFDNKDFGSARTNNGSVILLATSLQFKLFKHARGNYLHVQQGMEWYRDAMRKNGSFKVVKEIEWHTVEFLETPKREKLKPTTVDVLHEKMEWKLRRWRHFGLCHSKCKKKKEVPISTVARGLSVGPGLQCSNIHQH